VPYRLLKSFHKIQSRLVRELEKKFSGKDVVLIANRRIMAPPTSGISNSRPRSRTLSAVRPVGYWKGIGESKQYTDSTQTRGVKHCISPTWVGEQTGKMQCCSRRDLQWS